MPEAINWDTSDGRPELALITNHGYAGVEIPVGGAADTGGQNFYVNSLAMALQRLGYRVTIFARGGFPFFESDRMRDGQELLSTHVRYVYIPGGGEEFLRKEDIAVALDEEVEWLDGFIRQEAAARGCQPWEVFELVNTHYWDAAVLGMRLVERWRADQAMTILEELLDGVVAPDALAKARQERHDSALGDAIAYMVGRLLVEATGAAADPPSERARAAFEKWAARHGGGEADTVAAEVAELAEGLAPALGLLAASSVLGEAVLAAWDPEFERLDRDFEAVDLHVWTPHSLGCLKEENFRDKAVDLVRPLKFCERRAHERSVCHATAYFVATSEEIADRLHTHFDVDVESIFYFPPCVDRELFRPYSEEELAPVYDYLAEKSGIAADTLKAGKIVFETSRMDHTKRKDVLLRAFSRVARELEDVYLFIGGGPESSPVFAAHRELWASDEVLKERACLLGFIPDKHLAPIFSLADVFASASEMEGFGMSACQAAGCGVAVVLSDLIPFGVQYASDAAIIFRAGDEAAMAAGIRELLADDAARAVRGKRLAEITRVLDWETQSQAFLDHLRRAGLRVAQGKAS
ncbi:MAG: glycosyltransferase [bacterium]